MIERIYLEDWAYNAGIVGFINILENSNKDFVITNKNCIFVNDVKQNDIKIKFNHKLNIKLNI